MELKSRSLLNRDAIGRYKFAHKSILEYFLAIELAENESLRKNFTFENMDMSKLFLSELAFSNNVIKHLTNAEGSFLLEEKFDFSQVKIDQIIEFIKKDKIRQDSNLDLIKLGLSYSIDRILSENFIYKIKAFKADKYNRLGIAYRKQQSYEEAIHYYLKAIELDPKSAIAYNNLGVVYEDQKNYEEAIHYYLKAIELDPKFAIAYMNRGNVFRKQKNYETAIRYYTKVIELDPKFAIAYTNLGDVFRKQKNYEKAIHYYTKVIELDPKSAIAYNELGIVYENQENYKEAIHYYTKAIELDPKLEMAYNNLGVIYENQKNYEEAISYYLKAIELDPKLIQPYKNMGDVYRKQKKYEESIYYYKKAIEIDSKDTANYFSVALTYSYLKDYPNSIEYYRKAIELDSTIPNRFANLSQILFITGKTAEAVEALNKAFALNPVDTDLLVELWFCTYAHISERRDEAEAKLIELIANGAKSEGWDFSANIEKAIADGHPNLEKLREFAEKISGR